MTTIFAHAGHHNSTMTDNGAVPGMEHCMPILIGAGLIIVVLLGIIFYMLRTMQSKKSAPTKNKKKK